MTELDTLKRRRLLFVASRPNTALIDTGPDPLHEVDLQTINGDAGHAQKSTGKTTSNALSKLTGNQDFQLDQYKQKSPEIMVFLV